MDFIDKTVNTQHNLNYKVGDTFKLINKFNDENNEKTDDVLMIVKDVNDKYYFASLIGDEGDSGKLYGWGNGHPAKSIKKLIKQLGCCKIVPVKATITIENK